MHDMIPISEKQANQFIEMGIPVETCYAVSRKIADTLASLIPATPVDATTPVPAPKKKKAPAVRIFAWSPSLSTNMSTMLREGKTFKFITAMHKAFGTEKVFSRQKAHEVMVAAGWPKSEVVWLLGAAVRAGVLINANKREPK